MTNEEIIRDRVQNDPLYKNLSFKEDLIKAARLHDQEREAKEERKKEIFFQTTKTK